METEERLESTPAPEQTRATPNVWGPWATLGLTLAVIFVSAVLGAIPLLLIYAVLVLLLGLEFPTSLDALESDGLLLVVAVLVQAVIALACLAALVRLRRTPFREYLNLFVPPVKVSILCLGLLLVFLATMDCVTVFVLDRALVPQTMVETYQTTGSLLALALVIVIVAPLWEELLFRGFLFKGVAAKWGGVAAAIISAVLWASLHLQYDLYGVGQVLLTGLFLGVVRLRTGSTMLVIGLHAINNLVATVETVIVAGGTAP